MKSNHLACTVTGAVVAASVAVALSCGGGGSPTAPVTPTPTTSTTPPPNNGGVSYACKLGDGSPNFDCAETPPKLYDEIVAAIDRMIKLKPQAFDLKDEAYPPGSGNYKVLDRDVYLDGVVIELIKAGLCAQRDPDDYNYERIMVKKDNAASEEYDIISGSGYIRQNQGAYRTTCSPAAFPLPRDPVEAPPAGSGCGRPYPVVTRFKVWIHLSGNDTDVLDTTPQVGPNIEYCAAVGFTDGRSMCAVRQEGSPERVPCENWAVGNAEDTGRPGPTWRNERNQLCTGGDSRCENHPTNQYALNVKGPGVYSSCGRNGACGWQEVK
jgi:hypothetical protein